ncbi:hypothetical protein [Bacillus bingmayongensis]|uniref:hypothetical protein n=1 Tax=Bacillus bingmayongensis TaxID=1150157 RepID=UPI0002DDF2A2|nr:hypothetical protein [Bacillus bingmayongensis]
MEERIDQLEKMNSDLYSAYQEQQNRVARLEWYISSLYSENRMQQESINQLACSVEGLTQTVSILEQKINTKVDKIDVLQTIEQAEVIKKINDTKEKYRI